MKYRRVSLSPLEDAAMLFLTARELLCTSLDRSDAVFGRNKGLKDSMINMLMFPLQAFKDGQQNRNEHLRFSFSNETFMPGVFYTEGDKKKQSDISS